jgi:hypothetical protein
MLQFPRPGPAGSELRPILHFDDQPAALLRKKSRNLVEIHDVGSMNSHEASRIEPGFEFAHLEIDQIALPSAVNADVVVLRLEPVDPI